MRGFKYGSHRSQGFLHKIQGPASHLSLAFALFALPGAAQVFTVTPEGLDGKYLDFQPTNIAISTVPLTSHARNIQASSGNSL